MNRRRVVVFHGSCWDVNAGLVVESDQPEHVLGFHAIHQGVQGLLARIQWFTEHGSGPVEHRDQAFGWAVVILFRHWRFELNQAGQGFLLLQGDYVEIKVGGKFHDCSFWWRIICVNSLLGCALVSTAVTCVRASVGATPLCRIE